MYESLISIRWEALWLIVSHLKPWRRKILWQQRACIDLKNKRNWPVILTSDKEFSNRKPLTIKSTYMYYNVSLVEWLVTIHNNEVQLISLTKGLIFLTWSWYGMSQRDTCSKKCVCFNTMKLNHIIAIPFDVCLKPGPLTVTTNWLKHKHKILRIIIE